MALNAWEDSFKVDVQILDAQHYDLFLKIAELRSALEDGEGRNILGRYLHDLIQHMREHFSLEEQMLSETNYPAIERHRAAHRRMLRDVRGFVQRHESGEVGVSIALMRFLDEVLAYHILGHDRPYSEHLHHHGIQ